MSDVKRYAAVLNDLAEMRHVGDEQASEYELTSMVCASDYDALAARVAQFRAVLDDLYSVQNGCPLPKYQADWDAAMLAAGRLLGYRIPAADGGCHE